jgi:hypothetical protein
MTGIVESRDWARETFGECALGDVRRTKRLVTVAQRIVEHPAGSFPAQMPDWAELKAAYRLFDADDVTFHAVAQPHWQQTRTAASGKTLVVCDTTELNFGSAREGLGRTGNGAGHGFLLHNALMVDGETRSVLGVAAQTLHYRPHRKHKKKKQNSSQALNRSNRESRVWWDVIDEIGPSADDTQHVYVCDRGADNFEVFCHLVQADSDWIVRAKKQKRNLLLPDGEKISLPDMLDRMTMLGTYELTLRSRPGQPSRVAQLEVSSMSVRMPVPHHKSPWVRAFNPEPIEMNLVRVREVDAPADGEPIEWLLWTSLPADSLDAAWVVIEDYESRWLVEEYHKALKSGTQVKARQLQTASRLEPLVGLLSVVAVHLLQLKTLAVSEPSRPARTMVPPLWLTMLKAARGRRLRRVHDMTIYDFYREVAKLGGFLGRKSDGEPGWITIWRGWEKLATLVHGAQLAQNTLLRTQNCG